MSTAELPPPDPASMTSSSSSTSAAMEIRPGATPSADDSDPSPAASPASSTSSPQMDELDQLGSRLERFAAPASSASAPPQPSPRKRSAGSQIPKPEVAPKPSSHLISSMMKGANLMSQSLRSPSKSKPPPSLTTSTTVDSASASASASASTSADGKASSVSTASMLKSTLKRMTRLSIHPSKNSDSKSKGNSPEEAGKKLPAGGTKRHTSPSSVSRSKSFKEPEPPQRLLRNNSQTGLYGRNTVMSSSLRRPARNKEREERPQFQRSGTGGTLERRQVNRSHSVTNRRFRDRDLNVRKSRAVQTQLTRDVVADDDDVDLDIDSASNVSFQLYLPDVLGAEVDPVETHVAEPTEPVDVRKNRQLTLDNMKLHREVEKMKLQVAENDNLKKDLRQVKSKLEEEQRSRVKIEQQLDRHNQKVKMIVQSMDCVEKEFETRDDNIQSLERRLADSKSVMGQMQTDLDTSGNLVVTLRQELAKSLDAQKVLLQQYHEAEAESRELQEFLQAEKMTLAETLKDCEAEIAALKRLVLEKESDVAGVEERCSHLVRLGEQRHQEVLALQAQLTGVQDRAKDMLLAQGAEISRANIHVAELYARLERMLSGDTASVTSQNGSLADTSAPVASLSGRGESLDEANSLEDDDDTPASNSNAASVPSPSVSTAVFPSSESLQNLSKAITQRQRSENGGPDSFESNNSSLPSLVDKIHDVQALFEKFVKQQQQVSVTVSKPTNGHHEDLSPATEEGTQVKVRKGVEEEEAAISNGGGSNGQACADEAAAATDELLKEKDKEIKDLKSTFLKHRQILMTNYQDAEAEIHRLDDIFHQTVDQVLKAFNYIPPEVVNGNPALLHLQSKLKSSYLGDGSAGGSGSAGGTANGSRKGMQREITSALKADHLNANQSL